MDIEMLFEKFQNDHGKFADIPEEQRLSNRPDLCAFILLNNLVPGDRDIVNGAEHDQIYLSAEPTLLAEICTEDHIRTLVRCGVFYDTEVDSLAMFV